MTDQLPILDQAVLDELRESVGGDENFVVELATAYLAEGGQYVADMVGALERGDIAGVVRPAHTLKSSSAAVGASRLAEISRGIEHAARDGQTEGLADAISNAETTWAQTQEAMRAEGLEGGL